MGDVIDLDVPTTLDLDPPKVLTAAAEANLTTAMVIGEDSEGRLYLASSTGKIGALLILLELAKRDILSTFDQ